MDSDVLRSGDPIYVPSEDLSVALSLGASLVEGDARLRIPSPLPSGVQVEDFEIWATIESKIIWLSEYTSSILGIDEELLDLASASLPKQSANRVRSDYVKLFVPYSEMDRARVIPGVKWSRELGLYIADKTAKFDLIFPFLTERSKALWALDKNIRSEIDSLVKARALVSETEVGDNDDVVVRERDPSSDDISDQKKISENN